MTRHISDFRIAGLTAVAAIGVLVAIALQALVATLGSVEPVGGHAADIALDEAREFLYVANFGLARIDLVARANQSVGPESNSPAGCMISFPRLGSLLSFEGLKSRCPVAYRSEFVSMTQPLPLVTAQYPQVLTDVL